MNQGRTVLSQILDFVSKYEFDKCVKKYKGNYRVRSFTCWEQFIVMAFAQLTYRESLRDIESCLGAIGGKLYHSGVKSRVGRSTLADANGNRDWRIYAGFAQPLIREARTLYQGDNRFSLDMDEIVYALDSTTIDLCLSLFPWARFRKNKGAVKMHTQLDLRGSIPTFIDITDGKVHDVNFLDDIFIEPNAFYIMDRAYLDFERLYHMHCCMAFFLVREKRNFNYRRIYSAKVDRAKDFKCDQTIKLTGFYTSKKYPEKLRRIKYRDPETGETLIFLTNNFVHSAELIADLYKERWGDRTVLQVDKTAPENQKILREQSQRRIYPDMDRRERLPIGGHNEEKNEIGTGTLHYFTDIEHQFVRKSASESIVYETQLQKRGTWQS